MKSKVFVERGARNEKLGYLRFLRRTGAYANIISQKCNLMPVTTFAKVRRTRSFPGVYFEININLPHGKGSSLGINYLQCGYTFVKRTHVCYIYLFE